MCVAFIMRCLKLTSRKALENIGPDTWLSNFRTLALNPFLKRMSILCHV